MIKQDLSENQVKLTYLAIGSNLGNKLENIERAKFELQYKNIKILKSSSNYQSESWPNPLNPKFINIVVEIKTDLPPLELLKICNKIEIKIGRRRTKKNAHRSCDIDIIDYEQRVLSLSGENLILPHPRMSKRNFVLLPLFEINKSWKHPKFKNNIVNLLNSLPIKDLTSIKQI